MPRAELARYIIIGDHGNFASIIGTMTLLPMYFFVTLIFRVDG